MTIEERAVSDFPTELAPDGNLEVIKNKDHPDFGIGGIDSENRLIDFGDDGWIVGWQLEGAGVKQTRFGKTLDAEYETITDQQMPEEFMRGRDTTDWVWVHPRYRWLTGDSDA